MSRRSYAFTIGLRSLVWQDEALCQDMPTEWFYALGPIPAGVLDVCEACPVRRQCLDYAMTAEGDGLSTQYRFGVWGGTSAKERARLAQEARSA